MAREAIHHHDLALGLEMRGRGDAHSFLDACAAEQFHGAHVEESGAGQGRGFAQALDHQRRNAMLGQKHCERHSNQTTTCDEYRCVYGRVHGQYLREAIFAPSTNARILAQTTSRSIPPEPTWIEKPQSAPAITLSRPTRSA